MVLILIPCFLVLYTTVVMLIQPKFLITKSSVLIFRECGTSSNNDIPTKFFIFLTYQLVGVCSLQFSPIFRQYDGNLCGYSNGRIHLKRVIISKVIHLLVPCFMTAFMFNNTSENIDRYSEDIIGSYGLDEWRGLNKTCFATITNSDPLVAESHPMRIASTFSFRNVVSRIGIVLLAWFSILDILDFCIFTLIDLMQVVGKAIKVGVIILFLVVYIPFLYLSVGSFFYFHFETTNMFFTYIFSLYPCLFSLPLYFAIIQKYRRRKAVARRMREDGSKRRSISEPMERTAVPTQVEMHPVVNLSTI